MLVDFNITRKQLQFIEAKEDEVLYGGAAGGGKSYGQVIDAFIKAVEYPGIRQAIFRNSFPELNRSIILTALSVIPKDVYTYNSQSHTMTFKNGSVIEFGYIAADSDVSNYQSAEYDIIRFDELTHFTEYQYKYMLSRIRGVNGFPKQMKSSTNPGNRGHAWVKKRFIAQKEIGKTFTADKGRTFIFIPALVQDNKFLMDSDPGYIERLENLPEHERKALLHGEWDIYEGQFFEEFCNRPENYETREFTHVIKAFTPPREWRIYRSFDFGYAKPFSLAWWAVDYDGRLYRILELYGCAKDANGEDMPNVGVRWTPDEIFSRVADTEKNHPWLAGKQIYGVADPSIWDVSRGTSVAETAERHGIYFDRGDNKRLAGWQQVHQRFRFDEYGVPMMYIFDNCKGFIRTIPEMIYDTHRAEDLDTELEDHIADEVRYMCMAHVLKPEPEKKKEVYTYNPLDTTPRKNYRIIG